MTRGNNCELAVNSSEWASKSTICISCAGADRHAGFTAFQGVLIVSEYNLFDVVYILCYCMTYVCKISIVIIFFIYQRQNFILFVLLNVADLRYFLLETS